MHIEQLSDTLHRFSLSLYDQPDGLAVNLGACVGPDGVLMVDTGWTQTAERLREQVKALHDGAVKLILITHSHGDHYGGAAAFRQEATLIAHRQAGDEVTGRYYALDQLPARAMPIITLEDDLSLTFNGEEVHVIPAPGHTHNDVVVYFATSGVVFMGDLLFSDMFPGLFVVYGGNADRYVENVGRLIDRLPADVRVVAGHGRDYTMDELREYHHMAADTLEVIKAGVAAGKTVQDMVEEKILEDWARWDSPVIDAQAWIGAVYGSVTGEVKRPVAEPLTQAIVEGGTAAAVELYRDLKANHPGEYDWSENQLNMLGYQLLWRDMAGAAIAMHELNVQAYPESANPCDSLGETYAAIGETGKAIEWYRKALEIAPDTPSAIEALERLTSGE